MIRLISLTGILYVIRCEIINNNIWVRFFQGKTEISPPDGTVMYLNNRPFAGFVFEKGQHFCMYRHGVLIMEIEQRPLFVYALINPLFAFVKLFGNNTLEERLRWNRNYLDKIK